MILVGERLATSPGAYSAAIRLAEATGARLGWVPRRAGDRGALEAGAAPNLLPGGRPLADPTARKEVAVGWHVDDLPDAPGRDTSGILAAATDGTLQALLIGGVELGDLPDPGLALTAVEAAPFVVSLELRHSDVTERADVVFPIAPVTEKSGTFVNWEGRQRPFESALPPNATADVRVLAALADEVGVDLALPDAAAVRAELAKLGSWQGTAAAPPTSPHPSGPNRLQGKRCSPAGAYFSTQAGSRTVNPTSPGPPVQTVVRLSEVTAAEIGAAEGKLVTVSTASGAISLPLEITDMPDRVAWLPLNSPGSAVAATLRASVGELVAISGEGGPRVNYPDLTSFGHDPWWLVIAKALLVFVFLLLTVLVAILLERKVLGWMQFRPGPNRVGPWGLLQSLADGVKLALKEGLIPAGVDKPIYLLAPIISVTPAIMAFAVIPMGGMVSVFGHRTPLQLTDLPVAVLYVLGVTSIGVYGIVLAGWASRVHLSPARRPSVQRAGDLLRDRHGAVLRRGLPVLRHDVDVGDRRQAAAPVVRLPPVAVVPDLRDVHGRGNQQGAIRSARSRR